MKLPKMQSRAKFVVKIIPYLLLAGFFTVYEINTLNKEGRAPVNVLHRHQERSSSLSLGDGGDMDNLLSKLGQVLDGVLDSQQQERSSCLSLGDGGDMDNLLSKLGQVFIVMPAKAAGTSFKDFARQCMSSASATSYSQLDNVLNSGEQMMQAFKSQMKLPSLIASHVYNSETICSMAKHATRETLFIYIYREETERMASAIKDMFSGRICLLEQENLPAGVTVTEDQCVVRLRSHYIYPKHHESILRLFISWKSVLIYATSNFSSE